MPAFKRLSRFVFALPRGGFRPSLSGSPGFTPALRRLSRVLLALFTSVTSWRFSRVCQLFSMFASFAVVLRTDDDPSEYQNGSEYHGADCTAWMSPQPGEHAPHPPPVAMAYDEIAMPSRRSPTPARLPSRVARRRLIKRSTLPGWSWPLWFCAPRIGSVDAQLQRFGANVRKARLDRGWTQEDLAHATDLATVQISRIERGAREIRLTTLVRLVDGLDVPAEALLSGLLAHGGG